tara:strand:- start:293 stop:934 length:642 start_codon:yes stop_codon:yes gene_type:complete
MRKKKKQLRLSPLMLVGLLVVLLGVSALAVKAAADYKLVFWQEAGREAGKKVDLNSALGLGGEADLGVATRSRYSRSQNVCETAIDNSTSTFAHCENTTGRDIVLKNISIVLDDDATLNPSVASPVLFVATSTNGNATTTATIPLFYSAYTTSTSNQLVASSTLGIDTNMWQRVVADGEFLIFGWAGGQGQASPGLQAAPSSTGAVSAEFIIK